MLVVRDQFLAAGLEVLKEMGPSKLSIDRVCKKTKLTKGAFFHYFKSKEQFLLELIEQIFTKWELKMKEPEASQKNVFVSSYVSSCLNESEKVQEENQAFGRIILQAAFCSDAVKSLIRSYYSRLFSLVSKSHSDPFAAMVYVFALDGMMLAKTMDVFPFKKAQAKKMTQALAAQLEKGLNK